MTPDIPPKIISCLIYIQTDFTFLVPAYPGCPGKEAVKRVLVVLVVVAVVPSVILVMELILVIVL